MQPENAYKLANGLTIAVLCLQTRQQLLIGWWPRGAPLTQWPCMLESARTLFQQRQIMQRVEHILVMFVAAGVASQHLLLVENLNLKGIGAHGQGALRLIHRHGVTVSLILHLTIGRQAGRSGRTAAERAVAAPPAMPHRWSLAGRPPGADHPRRVGEQAAGHRGGALGGWRHRVSSFGWIESSRRRGQGYSCARIVSKSRSQCSARPRTAATLSRLSRSAQC